MYNHSPWCFDSASLSAEFMSKASFSSLMRWQVMVVYEGRCFDSDIYHKQTLTFSIAGSLPSGGRYLHAAMQSHGDPPHALLLSLAASVSIKVSN